MSTHDALPNGKPRIGVYVCHCGVNIAGKIDIGVIIKSVESLPYVVCAREYKFMCSDPGQALIRKEIQELGLNRVVVASCSPLMHEPTFRRVLSEAGVNAYFFQMANIREHVSWVTTDGDAATDKAKALVAAAVRRVVLHEPLERRRVPVNPGVLVVGGGISGIHAALTLANSGKHVYLVERDPTIGGHMAQFDKTFPTLDCSACILTPKMTAVRTHPNITLLTYSEVESLEGYVGNFTARIRRKSRFVDESKCTGCGLCAEECPVTVPSEFDEGLGQRKAIYRPFPQAVPNTFTISHKGTPPCQAACPLHQNVQGYAALIARGKYREALDVILRDNPLPSVCGRICTHPCTAGCTRHRLDDPLNVPGLKRFVADWVGDYELPKPELERPERVALVGAGPAGLMCAYTLRQQGYRPIIFEALPVPGGMLAVGIPEFRLPQAVLRADIERILKTGIEIRLNRPVGKENTLEDLRRDYAAVFVGIGANVERRLSVPGEHLPGVWGGLDFLRQVNLGYSHTQLSKRVLVIGGGNSALDAARTARRCGAEDVTLVYRRTRTEMPADHAEIAAAEEEGVKLIFLTAPRAILGSEEVMGLVCQQMRLGEPDASGRPRPIPIEGSDFTLPCDAIIVTIGQTPDLHGLLERSSPLIARSGVISVDPLTLETNLPGVFAGGDCVTGPDVVVNAMAAGRKAAISIYRFVNGMDLREGREFEGPYRSSIEPDTAGFLVKKPVPMPALPVSQRQGFDEVHTGYTEALAQAEAARCLACATCCDCRLCSKVCEPRAVDYAMPDTYQDVNVGAIVLATGYKTFDPERLPIYGYGRYANVYTGLEVERLINASGPTGGEVVLRDGRTPQKVAIIHCVGSRDLNTNAYCSRVCCMYSLKLAHLIREHTGAEIYNFYIDMRTPGKGYEEFYDRLLDEGTHFIRGRVAEVTDWAITPEEEGRLVIRAEDTLIGVHRRIPVDMVVLAVGLEPQADTEDVRRTFNISCSKEGWFLERHPKLAPVSTFTDGIFVAGACQGPKDIPDCVAQAGAAAAEAMALVDRGHVELEPNTAFIAEALCSGCKTCIPLCPYSAIAFIAEKQTSEINEALCKGCGACVAACPSGAAQQHLYTDDQIYEEIKGVMAYV
ncbi:MAG: FAD-dependent oxidoreductase [Candidatus Hydrogenedentes bacterium]|nr:FAD-dependent oxidoreductase [Candidatus Hydrogenedentota bacterium]